MGVGGVSYDFLGSASYSVPEDKSSVTVSLESDKIILRRTQRIQRTIEIPAHIMLMADIQMVIRTQQSVTAQVACIMKKEFDTRVGHAIF